MAKSFSKVVYNLDQFIYGKSLYPVTLKNGLSVGGGQIYPELNFTLPSMSINQDSMPKVLKQYKSIIEDACKRAVELWVPGFVVEIELLPQTTYNPQWGIDITRAVRDIMWHYEEKHQLKSALRLTPVDIREDMKCEHMWHGEHWDKIMTVFEQGAMAGADFLSIESIGGKDVHDEAIMFCNIKQSLFALGVLGCLDMSKLWASITSIANKTSRVSAGDTACGFGNTAMVLADKGYIPKVFSAVVRVMTAVRSLVAYEEGAQGPHKDCGYEGVYIKAMTGTPISMEGKSSACAHLSPLGNIAGAVADLWSNESVQNVKLLGGMAPTISMEQLTYDCRLMNTARHSSFEDALKLRDWMVESDSFYDPQAYVLRPDVVLTLSDKIVKGKTHFERIKIAARETAKEISNAISKDAVMVDDKELSWLDMIQRDIESISDDVEVFSEEMLSECTMEKFDPNKYDM